MPAQLHGLLGEPSPKIGMLVLLVTVATLLPALAWLVNGRFRAKAESAAGAPLMPPGLNQRIPPLASACSPRLLGQPRVPTLPTIPAIARQLVVWRGDRTGFRTMVAGEEPGMEAASVAIGVTQSLARLGPETILVDWSIDGKEVLDTSAIVPGPGITDVLAGRATFEDVIGCLPGSRAHVIGAGKDPARAAAAAKDKDLVNMLLDALDEVYDHIVITGKPDALRDLLSTIDGRIDAGVIIGDAEGGKHPGDFLGSQVADLDVIRYERKAPSDAKEKSRAAGRVAV